MKLYLAKKTKFLAPISSFKFQISNFGALQEGIDFGVDLVITVVLQRNGPGGTLADADAASPAF